VRHTVQRGAALLLAMLTVALVATLAAASLWQQWRAVEVETAERARVQSSWVLTGALDWGRLILREDVRAGGTDHLAEPWAVPLQESRLSTFLAADKDSTVDNAESAPDAFLSGQITDLQSRMNVTNLVESGQLSQSWLQDFKRLFELLGLPQQELLTMAENLRLATTATGISTDSPIPLLPQRFEQLVWLGLSPATVHALQPFVTVLPVRTTVNLNTASAEVIVSVIPDLDMAEAQKLVAYRARNYLRTIDDATRQLNLQPGQVSAGDHSVASSYFEVLGRLRLDRTVIMERSLVKRDGLNVSTVWRERTAADTAQ
jgi:general secretion pathway protein K